jgi:AcrR family transcriptional regulator
MCSVFVAKLTRRREPLSRRDRPAKAPLSRAAIVSAALRLIREGGDERLTLRRLAAELDTGAASLYVYFANTEELYAAVLDELLGSIDVRRGSGSWRERLLTMLGSYVELLYEYPVLARTALVTRPSGANSLDLWEAQLALLAEGGVHSSEAAWAVDLLLQLATATAAEHGARARRSESTAEDVRMGEAVEGLSADTHPHLAAAAGELLSGTPTTRRAWGLEVLINGVLATPRMDAS